MRRSIKRLLMAAMILAMAPGWADSYGDAARNGLAGMLGGESSAAAMEDKPQVAGLVGALTDQVGVSKKQALGGSAALLGMAKNQLSGDQVGQLTDQVPGLSSLMGGGGSGGMGGSLLSGLSSLGGAKQAFDALGMSPDMISQFAPVILGYLGDQGVGQGLLGQLGSIWSP